MWLACHTQDEIAEAVDTPRKTVNDLIDSFGEIGHLTESAKSLASHASEFEPMLGETADLPEFLKVHPAAEHRTDFEPMSALGAHYGLKSDIAALPKSAMLRPSESDFTRFSDRGRTHRGMTALSQTLKLVTPVTCHERSS